MINVILVDDQKIVREGIKMILSLDDEIKVVNEAENGKELVDFLKINEYPDVILMDVRMPIMDGVQATKIVKENFKNIKVIILTTFNEDEYIFDGIKNGADGYILKDAGSEEIIKAIKTAYSGNILLNPEVATKIVRAYTAISSGKQTSSLFNEEKKKLDILTKRELEVAKLVAQGKSNKEICLDLFITEGTVKNYLSKIFEKLELASRTELALLINQTNI
ncbi:response regulator transcription factor [Clostridium saccharoperbutylacetonicum]|jgi:DNA-binding NarL/FixJ family response regulator